LNPQTLNPIMLSLDQIIAKRASVRAYDPRPVTPEDIIAICEAARMAPSACNSQTWRFIAVTDRGIIEKICHEAMRPVIPNKWLAQTPLVIVGCSQLDIIANRLGARVTGVEYYQIDLGIAMEHMALKATELGLGSCWIGWFKEKKIRELLDIPGKVKISALLTVGYPKNNPSSPKNRKPLDRILFFNRWGRTEAPR
jgi:nitroreductase